MSTRRQTSAKHTFDIAIKRAYYLLKLAKGLTDHRKRRAHSDWSKNFKKLMRWPSTHQIERIDSKDMVLILRNGSNLKREDFSTQALDDLLRAALVMAVSAMDAYFHAKIIRHVVEHSKTKTPARRLLNERILVSDFIDGRRKQRSNYALRAAIERNLSFQSLQQPDKVADALGLIGVSKFWSEIAKICGQNKEIICNRLSSIVRRRNYIVHEGDLSQSNRTRNESRRITQKEISDDIDFILQIINAAEKVINKSINDSKKVKSKKNKTEKTKYKKR